MKLLISAKTNATLHMNMTKDKLTQKQHWDEYWSKFNLPVEVRKSNANLLVNEELNILEIEYDFKCPYIVFICLSSAKT